MTQSGSDDLEDVFILDGFITNSEISTLLAVGRWVCISGGRTLISWWRHQMETFTRYWPFVQGTHRSPVNFPQKGQWRGALMFSFVCAWTNIWANNGNIGDLRRHRAHYDVTVMLCPLLHVDSGNAGMFASITTVWSMMCANDGLHCNSKVILIHVHITQS